MDLLDLEFDPTGQKTSNPPRVTRRSQGGSSTLTSPKDLKTSTGSQKTPIKSSAALAAKSPAVTPKKNIPARRTPNPKVQKFPKKVRKTAVHENPKTKPSLKTDDINRETPESEDTEEPCPSECTPRDGRSSSNEKRGKRDKAKKRFSPSPVAKKRKSIIPTTPDATPNSRESAKKVPKKICIASKTEFTEGLRNFEKMLSQRAPVDFDIPEEWKSPTPSATVEQIISQLSGNATDSKSDTSAAAPAVTTNVTEKTNRTTLPSKKKRSSSVFPINSVSQSSALKSLSSTTSSSDQVNCGNRSRTFSRELGVDDEFVQVPKRAIGRSMSVRTPKASKSIQNLKKKIQKTELEEPKVKIVKPVASTKDESIGTNKEVIDPMKGSRRKSSLIVPRKSRRSAKNQLDEPSTSSASSSEVSEFYRISEEKIVPDDHKNEEIVMQDATEAKVQKRASSDSLENPNSALAIRRRMTGSVSLPKIYSRKSPKPRKTTKPSSEKKVKQELENPVSTPSPKKTQPLVAEKKIKIDVVQVPNPEPVTPISTAPPAAPTTPASSSTITTSSSVLPAPRASARVSKPNRLYTDETFNTEILGRTRITEQNPVKEAQAIEATPDISESTMLISRRRSTVSSKVAPTPKPAPIINGVQRGYVPSVKVPLEDIEVNGEVVKLNEVVTETVDIILFKICGDGVQKHEDIDPKVVKAKNKVKMDNARRVKLEAKKLDIQMKIKIPSQSGDLGKRKRNAPKIDDIYYTPPISRIKIKEIKQEEREDTPYEEQSPTSDEKQQQKARESISNLFDAEMDATIKEARKYSLSFDKYIKPKVSGALKNARIKLLSRKRQSSEPDDFYYHELLVDQVSPSNSNVENGSDTEDVDIMGMGKNISEDEIPQEGALGIRTEALEMAEQITTLLPRPTKHDGSSMQMDEIQMRALEHLESRRNCLSDAMNVILNQFGHESAPPTKGAEEQGCMWHTVTSANALALKNVYTISNTSRDDAITWTHQFLIENLPVYVLTSYLSVLRYARRLNPTRFGYIVNSTDQLDNEWTQVTSLLKTFVHKKHSEPGTEIISTTIPYQRMADTVFLLVPPTLTLGDHPRSRHHGRIFRWLQSIGHPDSEPISFNDDIDASCSVAEYLSDVVIEKICDKVRQKNKERPHCKVVLVGYGATTYLIHRAVNLVGGISAIISIGFPVMTQFGRRGTAEDEILLTYCPTLFIVGAEGQHFNNEAISELRSAMISPTGLVVVGHASDLLLVPTSILLRLGISQTVVFRIVLEKILDFLNLEAVRQPVSTDLAPIELNNIYDLDSALLKSDKALSGLAFASTPSASSSAAPSPVGTTGRRATVSGTGTEEMPKKKRESTQHSYPTTSSIYGAPPLPSPRADDRFLAFQNLVASTITTSDDMPRRASMGATVRAVERGDFREHRTFAQRPLPSAMPLSSSRAPVDPASISLN